MTCNKQPDSRSLIGPKVTRPRSSPLGGPTSGQTLGFLAAFPTSSSRCTKKPEQSADFRDDITLGVDSAHRQPKLICVYTYSHQWIEKQGRIIDGNIIGHGSEKHTPDPQPSNEMINSGDAWLVGPIVNIAGPAAPHHSPRYRLSDPLVVLFFFVISSP